MGLLGFHFDGSPWEKANLNWEVPWSHWYFRIAVWDSSGYTGMSHRRRLIDDSQPVDF